MRGSSRQSKCNLTLPSGVENTWQKSKVRPFTNAYPDIENVAQTKYPQVCYFKMFFFKGIFYYLYLCVS